MYIRLHVMGISTSGNLENRQKSCLFCALILILLNYGLLLIVSVHYCLMVALFFIFEKNGLCRWYSVVYKIETCNFVPKNSQVETEILNSAGILRHIDW